MKRIFPGQVFLAEHYDTFTKSFKEHMFVCVYVQALDKNDKYSGNIAGLMVTSKDRYKNSVPLPVNLNPFLNTDSYCLTAAIYSFHFDFHKVKIVGYVDATSFMNIISMRLKVINDEHDQCIHALMNKAKFEQRRDSENNKLAFSEWE